MTIDQLGATFSSGVTADLRWRASQLDAVIGLLTESAPALIGALAEDLGKHPHEAMSTDIVPTMLEAQAAREQLDSWAADRPADVADIWQPARAFVRPEPLGVVLIIGPWNFPVQLVVEPLIAAIAAGNAAVIKPSELPPPRVPCWLASSPPDSIGERSRSSKGAPTSPRRCSPSGSTTSSTPAPRRGRIVAQAAAKHLTPTTLELGGKCPTYVDASANVETAARRIAWTKLLNAGQI